jgi:methylthioribose-1-phosphate isomerase
MTLKVETLCWRDGAIELIDQRTLPIEVQYERCTSAAATAEAIRNMVVRGAPAIGCTAAYGLAVEALRLQHLAPPEFFARMDQAVALLAASRPTAVNLFWAIARMRRCLQDAASATPAAIADALLAEAHAVRDEDIATNRALGAHGAELLADGARVLTHCNAGALATAGHGTALGVIRSAVEAGKRVSVFVDETRPFLQGARLTAWELLEDDIPATLIADVAAGHLMSRGEIDAVIVGTDRVAANGDVANKIGTYPLAVLARRHRVPFYVACPISTLDLELASGAQIPIEERPASEVTGFGGVRWAPARITVRNPAFDVTPAELVTALITERGVIDRPEAGRIRALAR